MKKVLFTCFILLTSISLKAQSTDDVQFYQSIWGMEKRAIVESAMDNLTPDEETAFWAGYEAYEEARKELGQERIEILKDYADNYGSFSEEKATELINRAYANNVAIQKLFKSTFKKMSKSIDAVKVAKFIQLENYFTLMIQMNIQESIPFIDELEN
jgi:replicative superfamily II helicase